MTQTQTDTRREGNGAAPQGLGAPLQFLKDQAENWHRYDQPVTFDVAAERIAKAAAVDGVRSDQGIGDLSTWAFGPMPDGKAAIAPIPVPGRSGEPVVLREHAFGQLCEKIKAPPDYIKMLPAKLQMALVNYGLSTVKDRAAMLRLADGNVRAIVSDRYAALDDQFVLEALDSVLRKAGLRDSVRVTAVATGPTTVLRFVQPEPFEITTGDEVRLGWDVVNGEIGNRSVLLSSIVDRLVCKNGLRAKSADMETRLRHIGDPKRLEEAFTDALPVVIAGGQQLREKMVTAVGRVVDNVLAEFEGLRAFGLTATGARGVAHNVAAEHLIALPTNTDEWGSILGNVHDLTAYDVMNGITRYAQSASSVDARITLEEAAGRYLDQRTR